jgi:hypothetical protein
MSGATIMREKIILVGAGLLLVAWAALAWYGLLRLIVGCP